VLYAVGITIPPSSAISRGNPNAENVANSAIRRRNVGEITHRAKRPEREKSTKVLRKLKKMPK